VTRLLLKLPWFVAAPGVIAAAAIIAVAMNLYVSDYFERTFLDEADPLAGVVSASGDQPGVDAAAPTTAPQPTVASPTAAADAPGVLAQGTFRDGDPGHDGEGIAKVIRTPEGGLVLRFEEFSVTNGPDLFVVLSADPDGSRGSAQDGLNLGRLRATDGNINYEIPEGTDLSPYMSAVIYCRQFNVVFAVATLEDVT
jgi:hypothetical protein